MVLSSIKNYVILYLVSMMVNKKTYFYEEF